MMRRMVVLGALLAGMSGPCLAGPIVDKAAEAEALVGKGDGVAALTALDGAIDQVWTAMPMAVRKVILVDTAEGFGVYAPRESPIYKPGETIHIYTEPVGFAYGRDKLGGMELGVAVDFVLTNAEGVEVLSEKDFLTFAMPLRYRNREFQLTLTIDLDGAPAGKYTGAFVMRDKHSDKSANFSIPFEIAG